MNIDINKLLNKEEKETLLQKIESIKKDFFEDLDMNVRGILTEHVAQVLGFTRRTSFTGGWEVDHCNGRNSVISEAINTKAKAAAKHWADQEFEKIKVDKPEMLKAINRDLEDNIRRELRRIVFEKTRTLSDVLYDTSLEKLLDEKK